jgi:hypothetical protein
MYRLSDPAPLQYWANGVERIHRTVAVTIPFIEWGAEYLEAVAPDFVKTHASGLNPCLANSVITKPWPFPRNSLTHATAQILLRLARLKKPAP